MFVIAKYSSPSWSLMPWQEKCSSSRSSGDRSVKNSSTASLTTWAGSFSSVLTSKPPTSGSLSTADSASASALGARSALSPGSWYSLLATISALRLPRAESGQDPSAMVPVWRRPARVGRRPTRASPRVAAGCEHGRGLRQVTTCRLRGWFALKS